MRKIILRAIVLTLIILCSSGSMVSAQCRLPVGRGPRARLAPLVVEQKAAIAAILERADALEVTYNYRPEEYADAAGQVSSESGLVEDALPEGTMKGLMLRMWGAWRAASLMYGVCLPGYKGSTHALMEAAAQLYRTTGGREGMPDPIPYIVTQYNLQSMAPCRAQRKLFNDARIITREVRAALTASPTARGGLAPESAYGNTTAARAGGAGEVGAAGTGLKPATTSIEQVEEEARRLSSQLEERAAGTKTGVSKTTEPVGDWAFPKRGASGHYSESTNGMVYDLGDGVYAGHMRLGDGQGSVSLVMIVFSAAVLERSRSDFDLALLAASKVTNLPMHRPLGEVALGMANGHEHLFHADGGKILGVTLAQDRKTALARFR